MAVGVAAIDHQPRAKARGPDLGRRATDMGRREIGATLSAAKDHVAIRIAVRGDNCSDTLLGDGEELMRMRSGAHRVDGNLDRTVGAVLESDRHRETGREFPVNLAL